MSIIKGAILPIFLWILFSPWSAALDLKISHAFYENGKFYSNSFWDWIYVYGLVPAWILFGTALIGLIYSLFNSKKQTWRMPCTYLLLTFTIGGGLIIHSILKDHWGRPRPKQVIEYGGNQPFRPYYLSNIYHQPEPSKSFPCGHSASGFYFFSLALLGKIYHSRFFYWLGMSFAWILGILLSLARIIQGGHFFSDTLATALIMWLTAWGLAYILFNPKKNITQQSHAKPNTKAA